jgi:hypothetical protein
MDFLEANSGVRLWILLFKSIFYCWQQKHGGQYQRIFKITWVNHQYVSALAMYDVS